VDRDPKLQQPVGRLDSNGAILAPDPNRPEPPNFLEMKRRVTWIVFEQLETAVGKVLYRGGECVVTGPIIRRGVMDHSFVERPAA